MKSFAVTVPIQGTADQVWALLVNADGYPSWNPTVDKVEGRIAKDEKISVHAKISPGRTFPVKVVTFEPGRRMVWASAMPFGLFKGERTFTIEPSADGQVLFKMHEIFSGPLSPLIGRSIPDLQPVFDEFAKALKKRVEAA